MYGLFDAYELADLPIYDMYDQAFWAASSAPSVDRSNIIALGQDVSTLKNRERKLTNKYNITKAILFSIPIVLVTVLLCLLNVWSINIAFDNDKTELMGIIIGVAVSIIGGMIAIATKKKKDNDDN